MLGPGRRRSGLGTSLAGRGRGRGHSSRNRQPAPTISRPPEGLFFFRTDPPTHLPLQLWDSALRTENRGKPPLNFTNSARPPRAAAAPNLPSLRSPDFKKNLCFQTPPHPRRGRGGFACQKGPIACPDLAFRPFPSKTLPRWLGAKRHRRGNVCRNRLGSKPRRGGAIHRKGLSIKLSLG